MDTPTDTESAGSAPEEPTPTTAPAEVPAAELDSGTAAQLEPEHETAPVEVTPETDVVETEAAETADVVTAEVETEAADVVPAEQPDLSPILMAAVEQARAAIVEFSGEGVVGDYLGATFDDAASATHRFHASMSGYQGWQWAVVVATYPGADHTTVSEVVLVPGPDSLLAPQWVPWHERVQPGDLSPGDLLAPPADDPRLVPGYLLSGDDEVDEVAAEIGFGRRQVLSALGRADAAQRWHDGDFGPGSAMARATRRTCRGCAFYVPLSGSLGSLFGVCANELSADGRVVSGEYGCGAHSDTPPPDPIGSPMYEPFDDGVLDPG
jgi:hypothetical protein